MDLGKLSDLEDAMAQVKRVIGNLPWEFVLIPSPLGFGKTRRRRGLDE